MIVSASLVTKYYISSSLYHERKEINKKMSCDTIFAPDINRSCGKICLHYSEASLNMTLTVNMDKLRE